jgi:cysteinyl-tRNA synthetase
MAMKHLGDTLDIHCGGVDNIFPHHENEIAQSEAVSGKPFVRFWIHGEHLLVEGEKMSKSKGNFYTLRDLLTKGHDAQAIRYLLLSTQYRKQLNFTMDGLVQAQRSLERIKDFIYRLKAASLAAGASPEMTDAVARAREKFEAGLDDDLNTAQALEAIFVLIRDCNIALSNGSILEQDRKSILDWLGVVDERLAIIPSTEHLDEADEEIEKLVAQRNEARRNRDFARSDAIRRELLDRGIVIEDTKDGVRWRRK